MAVALQRLTDAEEIIMECIWTAGTDVSFPVIIEGARERFGKVWKRQTVSTFLSHLVDKEYLKSRRQGKAVFYEPIVSREEYVKNVTKGFMQFWYESCPQTLAANLAEADVFSEDDLDEIRRYVDFKGKK